MARRIRASSVGSDHSYTIVVEAGNTTVIRNGRPKGPIHGSVGGEFSLPPTSRKPPFRPTRRQPPADS